MDVKSPAASNEIACSDDSVQMHRVLHLYNFGVAYRRVNYRMALVIKGLKGETTCLITDCNPSIILKAHLILIKTRHD